MILNYTKYSLLLFTKHCLATWRARMQIAKIHPATRRQRVMEYMLFVFKCLGKPVQYFVLLVDGQHKAIACGSAYWDARGYAAHRNITGDSSSIFAAVLKGEQTFAFEPALELSQEHRKKKQNVINYSTTAVLM